MIDILIGLLSIIAGIILIIIYFKTKRENRKGLTINLLGSGIGAIMIGLYLIIKS